MNRVDRVNGVRLVTDRPPKHTPAQVEEVMFRLWLSHALPFAYEVIDVAEAMIASTEDREPEWAGWWKARLTEAALDAKLRNLHGAADRLHELAEGVAS